MNDDTGCIMLSLHQGQVNNADPTDLAILVRDTKGSVLFNSTQEKLNNLDPVNIL